MTKRRRRILIALGIAGVAVAATWAGAGALLTPWLRGTAERLASRALGRNLKIAGSLDVSFSLVPRVAAGDVKLANASWGSEPSMLRVGRVTVVVDLVSLWSGPTRVRELEIENARLLLERDGAGRGNWDLEREPASTQPSEPSERPRVVIERVSIRGLELSYRSRPEAGPVTLGVRELEARLDPATRMVDVRGAGRLEEAPWEASGRLGTLDHIYEGRDIDLALTARLDGSTLETRGRIGDLLALGAPDLEVRVEGPDVVAALKTFGLRSPLTGPFDLRARFTPAKGGVDAEVSGAVGKVTAKAHGTLGARLSLEALHVTIEAAGPDASVVGSWVGVRGLPPRPFDVSGRVRREGGRLHLDGVRARLGAISLAATGVLGAPPRLVGTDLTVRATGKDLSRLSKSTGLRLPPGSFEVAGRLLRRVDGLAIDGVELRVRDAFVRAGGTLGEPPRLSNLELTVDAAGPDLAMFSGLATVDLPRAPFAVHGRIARDDGALRLDGVEGRLGDDTVSADGRLVLAKRLEGSGVRARVAGPDLAKLAARAGVRGAPAAPFDVKGRVRVVHGGYELDGVEGSVGRVSATVDGRIGAAAGLDGTSLSGRARGPSLAELARWGLPEHLPADPFTIEGRLRIEGGVYSVDGVVANVGSDRLGLDGVLGALPDLSRLDVLASAAGPSLAVLARLLAAAGVAAPGGIPAAAYEVSGRVRRAPPGWRLDDVRAKAGGSDLEGGLSLRLDGKPAVTAELRSRRLDVAELLAGSGARPAAGTPLVAPAKPSGGKRLVPDDPLKLGALRSVDATLKLEVAELPLPGVPLRDVVVAGRLRDGALRLDSVEGTGVHGGRVSAALALEPSSLGYRLAARGRLEGVRLVDSTTAASREKAPSLDVDFDLRGEGDSLHDIAASLDGAAAAAVGAGQVSNAHERLTSSFARSLLDALNPFRASSDHTDVECGVASASLEHGKAVVQPIAVRTDKMTVVGHGKVDFRTEDIQLEWTIKPRTGVGLSPGSIANPFVKLGGTLSSPRLEAKPLEAAASTGAAIATMGLTVLARGFYDRITAEKKVCVDSVVKESVPARKRR